MGSVPVVCDNRDHMVCEDNLDPCTQMYQDLTIRCVTQAIHSYPGVDFTELYPRVWGFILGSGVDPEAHGIYSALYRYTKRQAIALRKGRLGRMAQYDYTVPDVYRILETMFDNDGPCWAPADAWDDDRNGTTASEVKVDAERGLRALPADMQSDIIMRYYRGWVPQRGTIEYRRLSKAVKALTDTMNNHYFVEG